MVTVTQVTTAPPPITTLIVESTLTLSNVSSVTVTQPTLVQIDQTLVATVTQPETVTVFVTLTECAPVTFTVNVTQPFTAFATVTDTAEDFVTSTVDLTITATATVTTSTTDIVTLPAVTETDTVFAPLPTLIVINNCGAPLTFIDNTDPTFDTGSSDGSNFAVPFTPGDNFTFFAPNTPRNQVCYTPQNQAPACGVQPSIVFDVTDQELTIRSC